jgi:signal transduction histidine kinase
MVHDTTERKLAEKAVRQVNKKLNLLSSITRHDIKNQLLVLTSYLDLSKDYFGDASKMSEFICKEEQVAKIIERQIVFTKEYESLGVDAPVWHDCRTLTDTAAKQTPLGQIIMKDDLPDGAEVFADPLIIKVFYNLMDNAMRHGRKITTIRFSVQECGDDHLIICEDDGDGVARDEKELIFERGFGKNTGLGLFLAREILSITGITIRETGEPGRGARFEMTVPKGAYRIATPRTPHVPVGVFPG